MLVKPTQVVIIRGHVGDIYLPGLQVDVEEMTMGFDWKTLFSLFFAEEKLSGKLHDRIVSISRKRIPHQANTFRNKNKLE